MYSSDSGDAPWDQSILTSLHVGIFNVEFSTGFMNEFVLSDWEFSDSHFQSFRSRAQSSNLKAAICSVYLSAFVCKLVWVITIVNTSLWVRIQQDSCHRAILESHCHIDVGRWRLRPYAWCHSATHSLSSVNHIRSMGRPPYQAWTPRGSAAGERV